MHPLLTALVATVILYACLACAGAVILSVLP